MSVEQLTLAGIRRPGVGDTGDELDRHFTPWPLAQIVVEAMHDAYVGAFGDAPRIVIEPSVGGGTIARAMREQWPVARLFGVDIDDQAEGRHVVDEFIHHDWLTLDLQQEFAHLAGGNPPFSEDIGVAHVEQCIAVAPMVALILPWEAFGAGRKDDHWEDLMLGSRRPMLARQVVGPRPWGDSIRQAALYVWALEITQADGRDTVVRPLPRWKQ